MDMKNTIADSKQLTDLRVHLKQAVKVLKTQPYRKGDRPQGVITSWTFIDLPNTEFGDVRKKKNLIKATPKQISHMHYWVDHMLRLEEEPRRIVMARAAGISWRRLEEIDGRSHTTLRKIEKTALCSMLESVEGGKAILPSDFMA